MDVDLFRQQLRSIDPALLSVEDKLALIDLLNRCFAKGVQQSAAMDRPAT